MPVILSTLVDGFCTLAGLMREHFAAIIGGTFALIGAALGARLAKPKPKLYFCIGIDNDDENEVHVSDRRDYNPSGITVSCCNAGEKPAMIQSVELRRKRINFSFMCNVITMNKPKFSFGRELITDIGDNSLVTIKPYSEHIFVMTAGSYWGIQRYCKEKKQRKCYVYAYSVDGKKFKSVLDLGYPFGMELNTVKLMGGE